MRADTVLGVEFEWPGVKFPASPEDKAAMEGWMPLLPDLFKSGTIKPNPILPFDGGLANITEGLDYVKSGKVRLHRVELCLAKRGSGLTIRSIPVTAIGAEGRLQGLSRTLRTLTVPPRRRTTKLEMYTALGVAPARESQRGERSIMLFSGCECSTRPAPPRVLRPNAYSATLVPNDIFTLASTPVAPHPMAHPTSTTSVATSATPASMNLGANTFHTKRCLRRCAAHAALASVSAAK